MSFLVKQPIDASPNSSRERRTRRASAAPVFKPEFGRSVRMHPVLAASVAGVVFALLFFYALSQKPLYEAESRVYIAAVTTQPLSGDSGGAYDAAKYDTYVQQQMQTAQRLDILQTAVTLLPVGTWKGATETDQQAAVRLQNALKVTRVGTSYELAFTLSGADAVKTADTVNAAVEAYLRAGRKDELAQSDQRTQILTEERDRIQAELAQDKLEQARLSAALGMANPGLDAGNAYDTQLAGLRTELAVAREAHDVAAAQLASVSGLDSARGLSAAADDSIAGDSGLSSMKATINQRRAVLVGQMAGLTPENPVYKQYQGEVADLDRSLDAMTVQMRDRAARRLQDKLHTDLTRTGDVEARLNAQLARDTYSATSASPKLQRATELNADIRRLMTRFATVDDSLRTLQLDASGPGMAHLALKAAPPAYPLASRKRLLMASSIPLALLCGLFAAVLARKRDKHIYTGRDIDDVLGFLPIAVLPSASDVSNEVRDEYMLRLAGGVEGAYRSNGARTFVLTPAGGAIDIAGMTASLEERLAHLGLGTATVTARRLLDANYTESGAADGESAVQRREPLRGADGRNEGFAAANLDALKANHDLVFIDAPAILTSAETEYVVRVADATILVAESGVTTRQELMQAGLLLERLNVSGIGAVLDGLQLRYADAVYVKAVEALNERAPDVRAARAVRVETPAAALRDEAGVASSVEMEAPVQREVEEEKPVAVLPVQVEAPAEAVVATPMTAAEDAAEDMVAESTTEEVATLPAAVEPIAEVPVAEAEPVIAAEGDLDVAESSASIAATDRLRGSLPVRTRRFAAEPEPAPSRGWISRLLGRDDQAVVSIIPAEEDEDEMEPVEETRVVSRVRNAADLDLVPYASVSPEPVMSEPVAIEQFSAPVDVEPVLPLSVLEPRIMMQVREPVWVPEVSVPEPVAVMEPQVVVPAVVHAVVPAVVIPEVVRTQLAEAPETEVLPVLTREEEAKHTIAAHAVTVTESALDEMAAPADPLPGARSSLWDSLRAIEEARLAGASRSLLAAVADSAVEAMPADEQTGLRVERWDAAPARRTTGPWRDRRVAGSDTHIPPAMDRRFNWAARASENAPGEPLPAGLEAEPARPAARPQLVPREPRLTRRWGLLSKFEGEANRPEDTHETAEVAEARGYRRG